MITILHLDIWHCLYWNGVQMFLPYESSVMRDILNNNNNGQNGSFFKVAGGLKWERCIWSVIYSFPTGLIINKFRIYGIFGGENLASCLAGWKTLILQGEFEQHNDVNRISLFSSKVCHPFGEWFVAMEMLMTFLTCYSSCFWQICHVICVLLVLLTQQGQQVFNNLFCFCCKCDCSPFWNRAPPLSLSLSLSLYIYIYIYIYIHPHTHTHTSTYILIMSHNVVIWH